MRSSRPGPCFRNISDALEPAGSSLEDVVRVIVYVVEQDDFEAVARVVGDHFRDAGPADTTVICALTKPEMKVEIEVTARRQTSG